MSPPHLGMVANVWQPNIRIQPCSFVALSLASQPVPPTHWIYVQQTISQHVQAQMNVSQPLQVVPLPQPILSVSGAFQSMYT